LEDKLDKIIKTNNELLNKNSNMERILEANQIKLDKTFNRLVGAHNEDKIKNLRFLILSYP
jgi:hypothetical protein